MLRVGLYMGFLAINYIMLTLYFLQKTVNWKMKVYYYSTRNRTVEPVPYTSTTILH